jgi:hypothetical protein
MFTTACPLPEGCKQNVELQQRTSETVFFHISTTGGIVDLESMTLRDEISFSLVLLHFCYINP